MASSSGIPETKLSLGFSRGFCFCAHSISRLGLLLPSFLPQMRWRCCGPRPRQPRVSGPWKSSMCIPMMTDAEVGDDPTRSSRTVIGCYSWCCGWRRYRLLSRTRTARLMNLGTRWCDRCQRGSLFSSLFSSLAMPSPRRFPSPRLKRYHAA